MSKDIVELLLEYEKYCSKTVGTTHISSGINSSISPTFSGFLYWLKKQALVNGEIE